MKRSIRMLALFCALAIVLLTACGEALSADEYEPSTETYYTSEEYDDTIPTQETYPVSYWDGTVASSFTSGIGTIDDPFVISTAAELAYLAEQVNAGLTYPGQLFSLEADIVLNDVSDYGVTSDNPYLWTPIGTHTYPFDGVFNGNCHTITGMYIDADLDPREDENYGLFGYVKDATISCLCIAQGTITGGEGSGGANSAGMLVGKIYNSDDNSTSVYYCQVIGGKISLSSAGGIVGETGAYNRHYEGGFSAEGGTYISNCCVSQLDICGKGRCGGIIGMAELASVSFCLFNGSFADCDGAVGGIAGGCRNAEIYNCYNLCTELPQGGGGIVGTSAYSNIGGCFYTQGSVRNAVGQEYYTNTISENTALPLSYMTDPEWLQAHLWEITDDGEGHLVLWQFLDDPDFYAMD